MEQEVSRWLIAQLGYNSSADATLSTNCRGNLKGLWEFIITSYKTADSKRHIQHVLAKHRREQEAARRAPEQEREAQERRQRLKQLQKRTAELEQTLASFQARTEVQVQEATDQACEKSLLRHVLTSTQAQTQLLQAFVHRGQRLLPEMQSRLSQLRSTLDNIKARGRTTGSIKAQQAVQQQVAALSTAIKNGLQQAVHDALTHPTSLLVGLDLQQQQDQTVQCDAAGSIMQRAASPAPGNSTHGNKASQQQQQGQSSASVLQELLQLCRLLRNCKLAPDATCSAVQLLQHSPSLLWDVCAQLAQQNLLELTARLDEAQREMLAPLHWPGSGQQQQQHVQLQYKADQQQLVAYSGSSGGHGSSSSHRRLPWSSGLSMTATAALQQRGVSLPPEVRVKMRLKDHVSLHVQTEQALQRVRALQQQLDDVLGSTALLQAAAAAGGEEDTAADAADGAAAAAVTWEAQLAQLFLNTARVRAQVALLQQYEHRFGEELAQLQEIKAVTEEKELEVRQQIQDDHDLNQLVHLTAADTMELEAALQVQQQTVLQLLSMQLLPCATQAADAARSAVGQQQHEIGVVEKLPVLELSEPARVLHSHEAATQGGPLHSSNDGGDDDDGTRSSQRNPVLRKATVSRLQAAGRQLLLTGRATTGGKPLRAAAAAAAAGTGGAVTSLAGFDLLAAGGGSSSSSDSSSRRFGDSAATAALKGASLIDPVAPLRCPAALLLHVAGTCTEAKEQQHQADALVTASTSVAASSNATAHQAAQLQDKVAALQQHELQEVLPQLQALLEEAQAARAFARDHLLSDLRQMWEMPAMHLVPHRTHLGKNCSQWLQEIQHLNAVKKELSNPAGRGHHVA